MIELYLRLLGLAVIVYACAPRLRTRLRVVAAIFVLMIPAVAATAVIMIVGDRIPPGAVTVEFTEETP